ncbi:MAG: FtsX-like permease family protein [Gaiellaceae bacterium]
MESELAEEPEASNVEHQFCLTIRQETALGGAARGWHRVSAVTALRRLCFPFWLVRVRLLRRWQRIGLVGLGLAAAAAMLGGVLAGTVAVQDRAVGDRVEALSPGSRAIHASWFSVGGQSAPYATLDAHVRRRLSQVTTARPTATSLYRESQLGGAFLGLGAVDNLGRWVRVRSGRLPRPCTPHRCEVLVIRRGGRIPDAPGLRLVAVGTGELVSATLFGDALPAAGTHQSAFVRTISRYHRPAPPPLVLANGVAALDRSPRLQDAYRTYSWVVPLDRRLVHSWSTGSLVARIEHARSQLEAEAFGFTVEAPTDELRAAADSGRVVARRLLLLGGEAVALLLAFAVLAAARLRPDVETSRQRLVASGVRRWQVGLEVGAEAATMAVAGTLIGWAIGVAVATAVAERAGEPVGPLLDHSVLSGGGIAAGLLLAAGATAALAGALMIRPLALGSFSVSPLDVAAAGSVVAVAVALARGAANTDSLLANSGTGVVLLLLPLLVSFAAAVAAARVLSPVLRVLQRAVPARALSLRLAVLALARRPGYAAVAIGFVVITTALALFAETYRSTLVRGEHDQASFAVPADYVVQEDLSQLIPVRSVATPAVIRSLGPGIRARQVTRLSGSISGASEITGITVLGLASDSLGRIDGWRSDFASRSPAELGKLLRPPRSVALRGAPLPASATRLVLLVRVRGTEIGVVALLRRPDRSFAELALGRTSGTRPSRLGSAIPPADRGGLLVAFRFVPPPRVFEFGGDAGGPATGTVTFGEPLAVTPAGLRPVTDYANWQGTAGVGRLSRGHGVRFHVTLTNEVVTYLRERQPTDRLALPAVVSPRLAAIAGRNGVVGVDVAGQSLLFRVAAVASRFPGTAAPDTTDFVVTDRDTLLTALNASQPGAGFPTELWLDVPPHERNAAATRLSRPPLDVLSVSSQAGLERQLQTDSVARGALAMLEVAAVTALVLAVLGLLLGTVSELRDDAAELFDLEAQGLPPAALRRQLRQRALVVGLAGSVGGVITGVVLSLLVVGFVELTANATPPAPPLVLALDWPVVVLTALAVVILVGVLISLVTGRAFRRQVPARYGAAT